MSYIRPLTMETDSLEEKVAILEVLLREALGRIEDLEAELRSDDPDPMGDEYDWDQYDGGLYDEGPEHWGDPGDEWSGFHG